MAVETGGLFVIDGEDAGTTPWEFDSIVEPGTSTFALPDSAHQQQDKVCDIIRIPPHPQD